MKKIPVIVLSLAALLIPVNAGAVRYTGQTVVDKDCCLLIGFRDGEIHYRDNATGASAYLGHTFVEGDDTLYVFQPRLDGRLASDASLWTISSADDKAFGTRKARAVWRKSKPMHINHNLEMELEHTLYLELPQSMKQGCTYTVTIPENLGFDKDSAEVKFDIWNSRSEAVHQTFSAICTA